MEWSSIAESSRRDSLGNNSGLVLNSRVKIAMQQAEMNNRRRVLNIFFLSLMFERVPVSFFYNSANITVCIIPICQRTIRIEDMVQTI
jgi:hypothetical protein